MPKEQIKITRAAKEQKRRRAEELRNLERLKEAELLQKINSLNIHTLLSRSSIVLSSLITVRAEENMNL